MRVLVVDDDEAVQALLREILVDDGHDVECASNGREACTLLERGSQPDLVLLDLMMPEVSGWEVLQTMGESPRLAPIPVVVLTAFDTRDDLPEGRPALHKPVDAATLLDLLHTLFAQQRELQFSLQEPPSDLMPSTLARHVQHRRT